MMLGRKQSLKGEPVLADYGPEEVLNESADIEWVNMVSILLFWDPAQRLTCITITDQRKLNLFTARLHVHWHLQFYICSPAWVKHISICHSADRGRFFICHYLSVAAFSIFGGIWLFYVLVEIACFILSASSGDNILVVASCL